MTIQTVKTVKPTTAIKPLVVATAVLSLTACTTLTDAFESRIPPASQSGQVLAEPNVPIDQPYAIASYDNLTDSNNNASIASQRWQEFYTDAKLKQLISLALENNKDLESAILAIKSAEAQYQIQDISDIPRLNASGSGTRSANNASDKNPSNSYSVNLGLASYEFDFWGKIANLKEQALQEYLGTTAAKDAAQISLISSVAQAYVNLSYAYAQKQLAVATLASRERSLAITKARFDAGLDSKSPSLQAQSAVENAKLSIYSAESNILQLQNALQYLVGSPVADSLLPESNVSNITAHNIFDTGLPSELLLYRPDVLQAEYSLKAAGANIAVARANYFPSISLSGRLGYSSSDLTDLFKTSAFGWSFGPSISIPLFDAGELDANYKVAQIAQQRALTSYEKSIQTAFKEVADVLATRATLEEQLDSQYTLQNNYQETFNIADARYKAGLDDYLSVLDAERSKFSSQQSILNLEKEKIISQIQLYEALGGGVTMDVPVTLQVPNVEQPVGFIEPNQPYYTTDSSNKVTQAAYQVANTAHDLANNVATTVNNAVNGETNTGYNTVTIMGNPAQQASTAHVGTEAEIQQIKQK